MTSEMAIKEIIRVKFYEWRIDNGASSKYRRRGRIRCVTNQCELVRSACTLFGIFLEVIGRL